jgi:ComF family protein
MNPISGQACDICGERLVGFQQKPAEPCAACRETPPAFSKATAFGSYDAGLRELIHLLKYDQVLPAARALGHMLAEAINKLGKLEIPAAVFASGPLLVIPVPLYRSKRRQRGFNQAELIARAALKKLAMPNLELAANVLERVRATEPQIGLTRPQRTLNIRGAFRVVHLNRVAGRSVLLVDDVLTTGTTASECARVLTKAGAKQVLVATVARTLKHSHSDGNFGIEPELNTASFAS